MKPSVDPLKKDLRVDMAHHEMIENLLVWHPAGKPLIVADAVSRERRLPIITYENAFGEVDAVAHHQEDAALLVDRYVKKIVRISRREQVLVRTLLVSYVEFLPKAGIKVAPMIFLNALSNAILDELNKAKQSSVLRFTNQVMPTKLAVAQGNSTQHLMLGIHKAVGGSSESLFRFSVTYKRANLQL